jgi:hypothetical protein
MVHTWYFPSPRGGLLMEKTPGAKLIRLAMPSVPLTIHQAGMLIQALALVQPHACCRDSVEALSA